MFHHLLWQPLSSQDTKTGSLINPQLVRCIAHSMAIAIEDLRVGVAQCAGTSFVRSKTLRVKLKNDGVQCAPENHAHMKSTNSWQILCFQQSLPAIACNIFSASRMGATCVVQPLDLVKNRMQLSGAGGTQKEYKTSFHLIRSIIKNEGFFAMYAGLSAGLLRQATYTTARLGIYTWLFSKFSR